MLRLTYPHNQAKLNDTALGYVTNHITPKNSLPLPCKRITQCLKPPTISLLNLYPHILTWLCHVTCLSQLSSRHDSCHVQSEVPRGSRICACCTALPGPKRNCSFNLDSGMQRCGKHILSQP